MYQVVHGFQAVGKQGSSFTPVQQDWSLRVCGDNVTTGLDSWAGVEAPVAYTTTLSWPLLGWTVGLELRLHIAYTTTLSWPLLGWTVGLELRLHIAYTTTLPQPLLGWTVGLELRLHIAYTTTLVWLP